MADIDVSALSLTTPPILATITAYRPAVLVRNNGLSTALTSGELRIYNPATGLLLYSTTLGPVSIPVGASRNVYGATYWTPPSVGPFMVTAQVTCPGDQVPANGILQPTTITVSAEPPPPPPTVPEHASQHENGGEDELSLDGLSGELSEPQKAKDHAENHQVGGSDELNVTGLSGFLADAQPIGLHAATHAEGGIDPVTGVIPTIHHESHEPGGSDEITGIGPGNHHATHEPGGDDELDPLAPATHADSHEPGGDDEIAITYPPHKASHEVGGVDAMSLNGLSGVLSEQQTPSAHATRHQPGGDDPIAISFPLHAADHEVSGDDVLNVAGLQGVLANAQYPQNHEGIHQLSAQDMIAGILHFGTEDIVNLETIVQPLVHVNLWPPGSVQVPAGATSALVVASFSVYWRLSGNDEAASFSLNLTNSSGLIRSLQVRPLTFDLKQSFVVINLATNLTNNLTIDLKYTNHGTVEHTCRMHEGFILWLKDRPN